MSKTRSLHHIVFATKYRAMTIAENHKKELYAYILGIIRNHNCFLHRINGTPNHVHLLVDVHPSIAIADLVKVIKTASNKWMCNNPSFPDFERWGSGYYAVSIGISDLEACKQYIINQEVHHISSDFLVEMEWMANYYGLFWHKEDWD